MKLAYLGRSVGRSDHKITFSLARVTDADDGEFVQHGEPLLFRPKNRKAFDGAAPGAVYELEVEENGDRVSVIFPDFWHSAKIGQMTENHRTAAQARDKTAHNTAQALKADHHPDLMEAAQKLARARASMSPMQQAAFDVWLLREIRKPVRRLDV